MEARADRQEIEIAEQEAGEQIMRGREQAQLELEQMKRAQRERERMKHARERPQQGGGRDSQ